MITINVFYKVQHLLPVEWDCCGWLPKITIVSGLLCILVLIIFDFSRFSNAFESFINWMQENPLISPFALVIVYIISTVVLIPGIILTFGAGFAFSKAYDSTLTALIVGSVAVWIGAMIGSALAMILGRYLLNGWAQKHASKYRIFDAFELEMEREGVKLIFLMRLCPLMPFNIFNYMMGITRMSIWDYSKGGLGMIPGTIIYVYLGTAISDISDVVSGNTDGSSLHLALIIVGTVISLLSIIYVSYIFNIFLY